MVISGSRQKDTLFNVRILRKFNKTIFLSSNAVLKKMYIKLFKLCANKFCERSKSVLSFTGITKLVGHKL